MIRTRRPTPRATALLALLALCLAGPPAEARAKKKRPARRLFLATAPPGAAVFVNGRLLGASPVRGKAITAGRAVIVAFKPGRKTWTLRVGPGDGVLRLGPVQLAPQPGGAARPAPGAEHRPPPATKGKGGRTARITVTTVSRGRPFRAQVFLDGRKVGRTPLTVAAAPGPHLLEVRQPGQQGAARRIVLRPRDNKRVVLSLAPAPKRAPAGRPGRLAVVARHAGRAVPAAVFVDGKRSGQAPVVVNVAPGRHVIELRRPGHVTARVKVKVTPGRLTRVAVTLKPKAP
jgi:hypothetical protein